MLRGSKHFCKCQTSVIACKSAHEEAILISKQQMSLKHNFDEAERSERRETVRSTISRLPTELHALKVVSLHCRKAAISCTAAGARKSIQPLCVGDPYGDVFARCLFLPLDVLAHAI